MLPHPRAVCKRLRAILSAAALFSALMSIPAASGKTNAVAEPSAAANASAASAEPMMAAEALLFFDPAADPDTMNDPSRPEEDGDVVVDELTQGGARALRLAMSDDAVMQSDVVYGGRSTTLRVDYQGKAGGGTMSDGSFTVVGVGRDDGDWGAWQPPENSRSADARKWLKLVLRCDDIPSLRRDLTVCRLNGAYIASADVLGDWLDVPGTRPPEPMDNGFTAYYLDLWHQLGDAPVTGYKLVFNATGGRGTCYIGEVALCNEAGGAVTPVESYDLAAPRTHKPEEVHPGGGYDPGTVRRTAASVDGGGAGLNLAAGSRWSTGTVEANLLGAGEDRALRIRYASGGGHTSFARLTAADPAPYASARQLRLRLRGSDADGGGIHVVIGGVSKTLRELTGQGVTGAWQTYTLPLSAFAGEDGALPAWSGVELRFAAGQTGVLDVGVIDIPQASYLLAYYRDEATPENLLAQPAASPVHPAGTALTPALLAADFGDDFLNARRPADYGGGELLDALPLTLAEDTVIRVLYRREVTYTVAYYADSVEDVPLHTAAGGAHPAGTALTEEMILADLGVSDWDTWRPAGYQPGRVVTDLPLILRYDDGAGGAPDASADGAASADGQVFAEPPTVRVLYEREPVYAYLIRYFYDGMLSDRDTVAATAAAGTRVDAFPAKDRDGRYRPDPAKPFEGGEVRAFEEGTANPNVFDVYYVAVPAEVPKTGDAARLGAYAALALMALGGVAGTLWWIYRRQRRGRLFTK